MVKIYCSFCSGSEGSRFWLCFLGPGPFIFIDDRDRHVRVDICIEGNDRKLGKVMINRSMNAVKLHSLGGGFGTLEHFSA